MIHLCTRLYNNLITAWMSNCIINSQASMVQISNIISHQAYDYLSMLRLLNPREWIISMHASHLKRSKMTYGEKCRPQLTWSSEKWYIKYLIYMWLIKALAYIQLGWGIICLALQWDHVSIMASQITKSVCLFVNLFRLIMKRKSKVFNTCTKPKERGVS